jgi:proton-dependent oligopeptide transporter, POT family
MASVSAARAQLLGEWRGYPKGALLIIGVEFWERFSFYGMLSILALFLTASPRTGGFGWPAAQALALVGAYSGAMYALPALGGFLADRVLGRRRAVTLGASCMLIGQILLASPVFLPEVLGWARGAPLLRFYAAIACLIIGNALMKSTLVVLCGETMRADDPRREAAYTYYYLGISVAAMLSAVVVGILAERFGWHVGFSAAAVGMAIALLCYVLLAPRWLGRIGVAPERAASEKPALIAASGPAPQSRLEAQRRSGLLLVLASLLCIFSVGWFQLFGSWLLFIERHVDRAVYSFVIPVPWFTSMNAAVVILLAPLVAALWVKLGARNRRIDILQKYIFALSMVAIGHGLMSLCARNAAAGASVSAWIPIVSLSLLGVGELVAWTATYGMVSRAAPVGYASVTMGAWYLLTLGLGGYLSGFTGGMVDAWGFAATFAAVAGVMGCACLAALLLRKPLARLALRARVTL